MSDYTLGDVVYYAFTTRAFATGVPTALAGSPTLEIYENDSTSPIVEGASKLVLTQNLNSINGFNLATITATTGNGFEAGKSYHIIVKTGTVGGTSIVGEVIGRFTLQASAAAADLANGTDGLGALNTAINDKTGYALSAAGVTAIWAEVMTGTVTAVQAMRGFIAALLGKASGLPTAPKYRNVADSKNVIDATTDTDGNRTTVTLDLT